MSILVGPQIDLTDCVLYLDAKNPGSYNGIGSIWYDCSGNNNHFTLTGTTQPEYDGSSIMFNYSGGNQYAICTNTTAGNFGSSSFSIEIVYKYSNASSDYQGLITKANQVTNLQSGWGGFIWNPKSNIYVGDKQTAGSTGALFGIISAANGGASGGTISTINNLASILSPNDIVHQVLTVRRNGLEITGSFYNNTIYNTDNIQYVYTNGGDINNNINIRLFNSTNDGGFLTGSLYSVKLYNRVLTQSEIANNYNVYRQYYGF